MLIRQFTVVLSLLYKAWRKPIFVLNAISTRFSFWRLWQVKVQARLYSATVQIGRRVTITHPLRFQGFGSLILEDEVKLGSFLAGLSNSPILFQPRTNSAIIRVGQGTAIMNGCELMARVSITIGKNCRIGAGCAFLDSDFHGLAPSQRDQVGLSQPIILGNNVWLGQGVTILKDVCIGNDAVVGAGCIVTKDIAAGAIAVGNPMRIIGSVYERSG